VVITMCDNPFEICGRHQMVIGGQSYFTLGYRLVITHFVIKAVMLIG
jgi:hypothetical protein